MDLKELNKNIMGCSIKIIIIGILVLSLGGFMMGYAFTEKQDVNIALAIFGGFFVALALFILFITMRVAVKNPLVKAIKSGDKDFLVWIYNKQISTTAGHGGATLGTSQNVVMYYKDGTPLELNLNRKTNPNDFITYLSKEFPNAHVGFDDATRAKVSELLRKKV